MRRSSLFGAIVAMGLIGSAATGCAASSGTGEAPTATAAVDTSVLPDVSITELLPTGEEYTEFNSGLSWGATTSEVPEASLSQIAFGGQGASAVMYGETCAQALEAAATLSVTPVEAASQEIGISSTNEFAYLVRYSTVDEAKQVFNSQVALLEECSKNEGTATFTPVDVNLDSTVAWLSQLPSTGDDFFGLGRKGDLIVVVSNTNDDAAEVGPTTLRYILNNLADKLVKG